jgi:deoxyribonuclease IV
VPLLGAHMSIAGGLHLAFERLGKVGGEALQIFTKNQLQWHSPPLTEELQKQFLSHWQAAGRVPVAAHGAYLINLAALDPVVRERSIAAFVDELKRCEQLGVSTLITHPGAHLGVGIEAGLATFTHNLDRAIEASGTSTVTVLVETTAGQGTSLGSTFDEIAHILDHSRWGNRLGACFDTCHAFAAGYDLRSADSFKRTFDAFDSIIGLKRLSFFHLNDSKRELGSRVDRHENIGKGHIGLEGFRLLLNDSRFKHLPMVLETPKGADLRNDVENLRVLRSLLPP